MIPRSTKAIWEPVVSSPAVTAVVKPECSNIAQEHAGKVKVNQKV